MLNHDLATKRRQLIRAGLAVPTSSLLFGPLLAHAQATSRMLIGYPAGGAVDVAGRALAEAMRGPLGSGLVVENKPGAGGTLAVEQLKLAPAEGQALLFTPPDPVVIAPLSGRPMRYEPADLVAVAQVCVFGFALAVGPMVPAKTFSEFLAWAKANPDKASYGTPGLGSTMHFLGEEIGRQTKVVLNHVPYKGGAQSIVDVIGGQVAALISTSPIVVPQHKGGKLRVLAVTSPRRSPALPDVPTFTELGFPALVEDAWFGLFVRSGTPVPAIEKIAAAARAAIASGPFVQAMEKIDFDPEFLGPAEFSAAVAAKSKSWAERLRTTGFKPQ